MIAIAPGDKDNPANKGVAFGTTTATKRKRNNLDEHDGTEWAARRRGVEVDKTPRQQDSLLSTQHTPLRETSKKRKRVDDDLDSADCNSTAKQLEIGSNDITRPSQHSHDQASTTTRIIESPKPPKPPKAAKHRKSRRKTTYTKQKPYDQQTHAVLYMDFEQVVDCLGLNRDLTAKYDDWDLLRHAWVEQMGIKKNNAIKRCGASVIKILGVEVWEWYKVEYNRCRLARNRAAATTPATDLEFLEDLEGITATPPESVEEPEFQPATQMVIHPQHELLTSQPSDSGYGSDEARDLSRVISADSKVPPLDLDQQMPEQVIDSSIFARSNISDSFGEIWQARSWMNEKDFTLSSYPALVQFPGLFAPDRLEPASPRLEPDPLDLPSAGLTAVAGDWADMSDLGYLVDHDTAEGHIDWQSV